MNNVPTFKKKFTDAHSLDYKNAIDVEQTTTFHACSVSK